MKKKIVKYFTLLIIWGISIVISRVSAVTVFLPKQWSATDYNPKNVTQVEWQYSMLDVIQFVNDYLWFAIWFVCFLFIIINWIKLITSRWDEKETSSAMKALIGCVVWIVICLSAYIIVNVALRLFN